MAKIKWRVDPAPTGRYRSFEKRGWPGADYSTGAAAAQIYSTTGQAYIPSLARTGQHAPLELRVAEHGFWNGDSSPETFRWRRVKQRFSTVDEAKAWVAKHLPASFAPEALR